MFLSNTALHLQCTKEVKSMASTNINTMKKETLKAVVFFAVIAIVIVLIHLATSPVYR